MNRTDVLNHLAEKYKLNRYLEIGLQNSAQNFDKIRCEYKVSVDPDPLAMAMFEMTSDDFFEGWPAVEVTSYSDMGDRKFVKGELTDDDLFDLVLIDGLHTAEQVKNDFENALKVLSPNGFIVLHDLLPETYERTLIPRPTKTGTWNGSCWKFGCKLGLLENFTTVDVDHGCGVWRNGGGYYIPSPKEWSWEDFSEHKKEILNVISWEEFIKLYDGILEGH